MSESNVLPAAPQPSPPPAEPDHTTTVPPSRLHPAWIFIHLVSSIRGFLIPLIFIFFSGSRGDMPFFAIAGGTAVIGLATTTAAWWVFRYEIAEGELRVHSGLISRQERSVPLERIQAIDIGESILQRLFGVVRIKVETAAGGTKGSDVTLEAMDRQTANDLARRLRSARQPQGQSSSPSATTEDGSSAGTLIKRLGWGQLLLAGATSGRLGPALAIVGGTFQFGEDVIPEQVWNWLSRFAMDASLQRVLLGAFVVGVIAWTLAIVSTILTFANFSLRRDGDHLLISAGLLDRRRSTIPLTRIQAVTISEGMLRQPFGLATVRIESAGYGGQTTESGVLFPIIRTSEIPDFLTTVVPEIATTLSTTTSRWQRPPARARRRYTLAQVWRLIPFVVVTVGLAVPLPIPWWWGLGILILSPFGALYGLWEYRDAGWMVDDEHRLIARGRNIARWTAIMPLRRIQRRSVQRNPFQRHANLGTFHTAVASGGTGGAITIQHIDDQQADDLLAVLGPGPLPAHFNGASSKPEHLLGRRQPSSGT